MDFIAVDNNGKELGNITSIKEADIEIGDTNTFELTFSSSDWEESDELPTIDYFYSDVGEIGGFIRKIKVMTASKKVKASGYTWRGYLDKKVIVPPDGSTHRIVSGDANEVIRELLADGFGNIIKASDEVAGINIDSYKFRYCTLLGGLTSMLASVDAKLHIRYVPKKTEEGSGYIELYAAPFGDYSSKIEFSEDGRINLTATDDRMGINHLICLGSGTGLKRMVHHLYVDDKGKISDTQFYTGLDEMTEIYDYSSVESEEDLISSGKDRLRDRKNSQSIEVTADDIDLDVGDIVTGREAITGIDFKVEVKRVIYKIDTDGNLTKEYQVGK